MISWMKSKLRNWILNFLGLADHDGRLKDVERHFVTKRDDKGNPTETLADVPLADRKSRETKLRGATWAQRKAFLEATDGGRRSG